MSDAIPPDDGTPDVRKRYKRVLTIVLTVLLVIVGVEMYKGIARQSVEPTSDVMAKIHLVSQCQEFNPNLSWEQCGQWSVGLKRDHPDNFRECVGDPNDEVLPLGGMYNCFAEKGLGP